MWNWIEFPFKKWYLPEKLARPFGLFLGVQCIGNHQSWKMGRAQVWDRL